MTGPGDVGGEVSGEEAAWRDLIAHYDMAAEPASDAAPWPDRENLTKTDAAERGAADEDAPGPGVPAPGLPGNRPADFGPSGLGPSGLGPSGLGPSGLGPSGLGPSGLGPSGLGPSAGGQAPDQDGPAKHAFDGFSPADRTRLVRPAGDPRNYSPPDEADDQAFIPPPLPPPKLDPIAKAAWAALIGGPAYLLIGVLVGWTISGIAAFAAIAAFVAGFIILVLRLGDGSKRDDDDDGAVI